MLTYLSLHMLTIDIAAIFAKKLQSMRVIVLNRLRDVDNISISVMIPTHRNKTMNINKHYPMLGNHACINKSQLTVY